MFFNRKAMPIKLAEDIPLSTKIKGITFTVVDTETTGFQVATTDRLIEIAGGIVNDFEVQELKTFQSYADPKRQISQEITDLTAISDEKTWGAPSAIEAV